MTILQLAEEMGLEFGEEISDLDIRDQFVQFAQEVIDDIIMSGRWAHQNTRHVVTLVDATYIYDMPVTMSEIVEVRHDANHKRLALVSIQQLVRRGEDLYPVLVTPPGPLDVPTAWYPYGASASGALQIAVWGVPGGVQTDTLTVFGLKRPAALALTDEIPLPEEFITISRSGIRGLVRYNENNLEAATLMLNRFDQKLQLLNGRFTGAPRAGSQLMSKRGLQSTQQAPAAPGGD